MAEWSKALVLGTSLSEAWVRIPPLPQSRFKIKPFDPFWWLVRVTLLIDRLFLPQNFGPVVRTYEGLLRLCECASCAGSIGGGGAHREQRGPRESEGGKWRGGEGAKEE